MATDLLSAPETDTETGQQRPCEMVELLVEKAPCGCQRARIRRCEAPAAFEMLTRCEGPHGDGRRLICAEHEEILRRRPEIGQCSAGHPSVIVAVLPLGGGS